MVDKCLQSPPSFSIPAQQFDLSTGPQLPSGQSIEDQLNSKGEPPEESLHLNAIRRGLSKAHQAMSFNGEYLYEGRVIGGRDFEGFKESNILDEAVLKSTGSVGKLSEEEAKSMASDATKSTAKSTPEDWFKAFNTDPQEYNNFAGYDDDPPYFIPPNESLRRKHHLGFKQNRPHKLSRISPSGAVLRGRRVGGEGLTIQSSQNCIDELAVPTEIMGGPGVVESTSDSNSDSYREVIDDLTIKNQKLKRRLRKLEELQAEHLQTDKVFELRIHGLSQSKRQELESLLQQFTSTLHNPSSSSGPSCTDSPSATSAGSSFGPSTIVTSDSAYVSNAGSGSASIATGSTHPSLASGKSGESRHSKGSWNATSSGRGTASSGSSGGVNGKKVPTYISEKAKMKQVVRRLEYLFTGKRSQDQHLAPNRQQSKAALSDSDDVVGSLEVQEGDVSKEKLGTGLDDSPAKTPELDARLPQIPEQNVEYLHNLTSTSPTHEPLVIGGHWDGWVYLNLVINLAQLHTINVTVPFVKKAISTMSVKLELSPDGKMVRWKGGMDGSNLVSESENKSENNDSPPRSSPIDASSESSRGRKRSDGSYSQTDLSSIPGMPIDIKARHSVESSSTRLSTLSRSHDSGTRSSPSSERSTGFHYKPLFAQAKSFDDDSSEPSETGYSSSSGMKSSSSPDGASGDYSGGGSRTRSKKPTVGPIIYYENGKFCTDLSTQEIVEELTPLEYPYERMTNEVVGAPGKDNIDTADQKSRPLLGTGPLPLETLVEGQLLGGRVRGGGVSTDGEEDDETYSLEFSPKLESTLPDDPPLPVELEASGIGGVQPEDNFAINVQVKHFLLPKGRSAQTLNTRKLKSKLRGITHRIPQSSIDVFLKDEAGMGALPTSRPRSRSASSSPSPPRTASSDGAPSPQPLRHELVSERFIRLPPSSLPPASYMYLSPSSDESRSDSDSGLNSSSQSDSYAESQAGFNDDSQEMLNNKESYGSRGASRQSMEDYMEESRSIASSRMSESVASSEMIIGRIAPVPPPESSAATAGSCCESMQGLDEEEEDEDISDDDNPSYYKNDSDEVMGDSGLDDESLDGVEDPSRRNTKRIAKSTVEYIPAVRNSKNARQPITGSN